MARRASTRPGTLATIYCSMDDYTAQIRADGGGWAESETLGGRAVVKVRASDATLTMLGSLFLRIPVAALDNTLASLTTAQKNRIHTELNDMGYNDAEVTSVLGNFNQIGQKTLGQLLRFVLTRRQTARLNTLTDTIVYDGAIVSPTPIEDIDAAVQ